MAKVIARSPSHLYVILPNHKLPCHLGRCYTMWVMGGYQKVELHLRGSGEAMIHAESGLLLVQLLLGSPRLLEINPHPGWLTSKPNKLKLCWTHTLICHWGVRGADCVSPGRDFPAQTLRSFSSRGSVVQSKLILRKGDTLKTCLLDMTGLLHM